MVVNYSRGWHTQTVSMVVNYCIKSSPWQHSYVKSMMPSRDVVIVLWYVWKLDSKVLESDTTLIISPLDQVMVCTNTTRIPSGFHNWKVSNELRLMVQNRVLYKWTYRIHKVCYLQSSHHHCWDTAVECLVLFGMRNNIVTHWCILLSLSHLHPLYKTIRVHSAV